MWYTLGKALFFSFEVYCVGASYKKLWHLLIDRGMKKGELCELACISSSSLAKLGKGENVNTDILVRICRALNCDIDDIMEVLPEDD
jgi:DNA-binding Xre family transcriptional regulator